MTYSFGDFERSGRPQVMLVSMPFGVLNSPSLALGILQAALQSAGIATLARHFTLDYAARIGIETYNRLAGGFPRTTDLMGEWIFSHALGPKTSAQQERYLAHVFGETRRPHAAPTIPERIARELALKSIEQLLGLAARAGDFADYAAQEILAAGPDIVGFTSVFEQNMASLAVARRLRAARPEIRILFGGANCEDAMGRALARAYPFIDYVISGEGDRAILPLVQGLLAGIAPWDNEALLPAIRPRSGDGRFLQTALVDRLDGQPAPVFSDYLDDLAQRPSVAGAISVQIPMETSRGCWWGAKHHCTFCGLNGASMAFRSKDADAVFQSITACAAAHPGHRICFVDNIMDHRYFETLLPRLAASGLQLDLFYEIKSNVTKAQVKALRDAGIRHVQPGIESLSDDVLRRMRKGVSTAQNLQLLKWCGEYGVRVDWNLLWGFPGEDPEDYRVMAELAPLLCHLEPPARGTRIRLDRFSPNFRDAAAIGFRDVRPYPAYRDIFDGLADETVADLAYFFRANDHLAEEIAHYTAPLADAIRRWQAAHPASSFFHLAQDGKVVLIDNRTIGPGRGTRVLEGLAARIHAQCDSAQSPASLGRVLDDSPDAIAETLAHLHGDGLLWSDGTHYLALALDFTTYLESRRTPRMEAVVDRLLVEAEAAARP